jgi:amino acid permease
MGFLMFGSSTEQIVIHSFPQSDILVQISNVGFFLIANAAYVMVSLQVMTDLGAMIFNEHDPKKMRWRHRIPLLLLTNGIPVLVAMVLPNVRPVFEIGGSFGGCLSNFCFPPVLYWWYSKRPFYHWKSLLLLALALWGFVAMVIGTYNSVADAIDSFRHGDAEE